MARASGSLARHPRRPAGLPAALCSGSKFNPSRVNVRTTKALLANSCFSAVIFDAASIPQHGPIALDFRVQSFGFSQRAASLGEQFIATYVGNVEFALNG